MNLVAAQIPGRYKLSKLWKKFRLPCLSLPFDQSCSKDFLPFLLGLSGVSDLILITCDGYLYILFEFGTIQWGGSVGSDSQRRPALINSKQ